MANTFTLIASSTVGSGGAAGINFSSIPSTYTDLCVKYSIRNTTAEIWIALELNNSQANFAVRWIQGSGTGVSSSNYSTNGYEGFSNLSTYTANTFSNGEIYIPNYAGSTNKPFSADFVTETNATASYTQLNANLWSNTAAINQVYLKATSGSFAQYSTAYLYGIKNS